MKQRAKITNAREATKTIEKVEELGKKGQRVNDKEREDYAFAKIYLSEIKKRKKR